MSATQSSAGPRVTLRPVTADTVRAICQLDAGDSGRNVAPNAVSIAQAYFSPHAWFRAIYADDTPAGFVMLFDPHLAPGAEAPDYFMWRLMVDRAWQRRGIGRQAVQLLVEHVQTRPAAVRLMTSHNKHDESLARLYTSLGFAYTGEEDDGELVMAREL
jgi:diamine N-acetyltransferase